MIDINKYNYEAWLLDYAEDNLSAAETKQVEAYLNEHPEVQVELDEFQPVYLKPDPSITFDKKELLKKEEPRGRLVSFRFGWSAVAAAAAILIAVVALFPLLFQSKAPNSMVASSEIPIWEVPAIQGTQPVGSVSGTNNNLLASTEEPWETKHEKTVEKSNEPTTSQREAPIGVDNLSKEGIASISSQKEIYYYNQSSVLAGISRTPKELNYLFQNDQRTQENNGNLINNILSSEVARVFVPEALEDELPERSENEGGFAPTIYLELPPAGKKLVDKIFKQK